MRGCMARRPPSADPVFSHLRQVGIKHGMDRPADFQAISGTGALADLLSATSRGDRAAFSSLYQRTSAKLYGICLRLLGSEAEAQDVLQDVYVLVWHKAASFDAGRASAITWLATVARNKSIDRLRRRRIASDGLDAAADVEDEAPSAFDLIGDAQDAARLGRCLEELEERARSMIRAAFLDGATYPELADREGVPLGTMKSWIRRGLVRLRGCLDQ